MARRKKGNPVSGWLLVDKPAGITSSAAVNKLRWLYQAQKAGHGGTLDPDATGLLPIAFGEATKLLSFLEDRLKCYEFSVVWGAATTTDDAAGDIVANSDIRPSREDVLGAVPQFLGQIEQIPPQVSAVKVDGERAYKLAREGEALELKSRPLWVEELTLLEHSEAHSTFRFRCGKGGYVRAIARDLGEALGTYAHVGTLRRTETLGFEIEDALPFDAIIETTPLPEIFPLKDIPDFPSFEVHLEDKAKIRNGNAINNARYARDEAEISLALIDGEPAAIVECEAPFLHVRRGLGVTP